MDPAGVNVSGDVVLAIFAVGMAASFRLADPGSPTSRSLATFLFLLGATMLANVPIDAGVFDRSSRVWPVVFSIAEGAIMVSAFEWILRVGRTSAATGNPRVWTLLLRAAQAVALLYVLAGVGLPEARQRVWHASFSVQSLVEPMFYPFSLPFVTALALAGVGTLLVSRAAIDAAEHVRLNALVLAAPFFALGIVLPDALRAVLMSVGAVVFLAGAVRYHVLQGQRGQFLARFLSPELAQLVREKGLASTLRLSRVELSVVACDLRGFTTFAESATPEHVLELLREYYDMVGEVISGHGGSIKDFAGDGVLALVGAPLPHVDHAVRAVEIALVLRERTTALLASRGPTLGVGIGVASGLVTVGAIGGKARLEYAAVGPTVNLASRLCMRAEPGQVLIAERTAELLGEAWTPRLGPEETMALKGFSRPTTAFALVR